MKPVLFLSAIFLNFASIAQSQELKVVKTSHIASGGGWDYIAVNNNKVYVSHGAQVNILDAITGDSIGYIPNTQGVHGIAFNNDLNQGYTSNGRANTIMVFDLKTNDTLGQIPVSGQNPDAIMYEPFTKTVITCNGRSGNLSLIDPIQKKAIATIDVGGKPETAVSDAAGKIFVNIENKNEIISVNLKTNTVENRWSLSPAEGPTGLAIDRSTKRLFAGCEKLLVVMNAENGSIVDKLPIGEGCDGVAFDAKKKIIYTSNGSGTVTAIKENDANSFTVLGNYPSKRGARTIGINDKDGRIFLPTADSDPNSPAGQRPRMLPGTFQVLFME